ncbi:hypothetical protein DY000_02005162 [Brassica cretica]|uniref:Uncharacterized protein n=1 Tax=Brassica cretica TaxID=69181 RepID=A0ABQ7CHQ8_BRACR|nr:hypothetical protein DY000_02005162 [Brassica cretica]
MTKRPLSRNEFEQSDVAQRPPVVAPRGRSRLGRSRLRERPGGVAASRRSGSLFASDLAVSLRVMETRATSLRRSGQVAPGDGDASDLAVSLRSSRSGQVALKGCHSDFTVSLP